MKRSAAILRADCVGPTSWPEAEVIAWPEKPAKVKDEPAVDDE